MAKILITGATGLLGKALLQTLSHHQLIPCSSIAALKTGHEWEIFDITDHFNTTRVVATYKPDIIIHCAAIGSVDKVQVDFVSGLAVNLNGTVNIINAATKIDAKLIMISTNAVFDGRTPPYVEDNHLCPISNYGIIKAAAELAVRASGLDWMVMRPILMYGNYNIGQRGNWPTIWLNKLQKNERCLVVNDTMTQPLYNYDCAEVIRKAIDGNFWKQIFNVGGGSRVSLYEFAQCTARAYGYDVNLIQPVPSSYFPNIAPRPQDTSYDLTKIKSVLGHAPLGMYEGLVAMRNEKQQ